MSYRRQNKQVTDALIAEGIRRSGDIKEKVHRAVSGAGNGFKELKDVVKEILKK